MHRRWKTSAGLVVTGVLAAVTLTACGGAEVTPSGSATTTTAGAATTTETATPSTTLEISDSSATQLCDMIRPELSNFRVQGPTLGRLALNTMVHEWALRNGGINGHVLADKAMIDRVTTKACADVRTETLTALDLPDLASGLAF